MTLYVHIPFCISKCPYCDFVSMRYDESLAARYLLALKGELGLRTHGRLDTLYVGGGTPTVLPPRGIEEVFRAVRERCELAPDAEITCEANPGTLDREKVEVLLSQGVTRTSLGVQSLVDGELAALGRAHSADETRAALEMLAQAGMEFSIDLIYGIPGQSLATLETSIKEALASGPSHVSAYELTPEPGTPLKEAVAGGETMMPGEELVLEMAGTVHELLTGAGFEHYEISNYALPGRRSRHNMNYWRRGEYIGVGAGAHSMVSGTRTANTRFVFEYIKLLSRGLLPIAESSEVTPSEAAREYVFLGLRLLEGLDTDDASARHGLDLHSASSSLRDEGLMELPGGRLRLTGRGLEIANTVTVDLLEALGL